MKPITYGSVCSGIEAATSAWHPIGWQPAFFSEIETFPSAVLSHRYPATPNLGDMTKFRTWPDYAISLLVGGTPCQSFSVAGLRKGLADPRGNLMLTYLAIAARYRPKWLVWENVPGVLSSNGGKDFGTFLGGLGELGYGFAYRVLDAQYVRVESHARAVPQRRRRVFVVGHLGDWRRAAAVLFERESLCGNSAPRREAGQGFTHSLAPCLTSSGRGVDRTGDTRGQDAVVAVDAAACAHRLCAHAAKGGDPTTDNYVAHSLRGEGFDASEDGTGRGTPLGPTAFNWQAGGSQATISACSSHTDALTKNQTIAVAFQTRIARNGRGQPEEICPALSGTDCGETSDMRPCVATKTAVRRLTPRECERLQGFPDDFTAIPWRGKAASECPDGPRYKALGNSMAVNCMRWLGDRIASVELIP